MPYAPGIQDISGQLIAQGMSQAGAARARAIESLGESIVGGIKNYQQNQLVTNQALGKFGTAIYNDPEFKNYVQSIVQDDPNAPQVPDALKKAFKNIAAGKPDIYDAALVGTAADGFQQARQFQRQGALATAQINAQQAETYQKLLQGVAMENARRRGEGQPLLATPEVPTMDATGLLQFARPAPVAPGAPAGIGQFTQPSETVGKVPGGLDPNLYASAEAESWAGVAAGKGWTPPLLNYQRLQRANIEARREQVAAEAELSLADAQKMAAEKTASAENLAKPYGQRLTYKAQPSASGRAYSVTSEVAPKTREELQAETSTVEEEKTRFADIGDRKKSARVEAESLPIIKQAQRGLRQLYERGELVGDQLAAAKAQVTGFAQSLGLPVSQEALAAKSTTELGQALMNTLIVPLMEKFKGSTSDRDVILMKSFYPQLSTNPKAALAMLDLIDARIKYQEQLDDLGLQHSAGDISAKEYSQKTRALRKEFNDSLPTQTDFAKTYGLQPVAGATGAAQSAGAAAQPTAGGGMTYQQAIEAAKAKPGSRIISAGGGMFRVEG